METIRLSAEQLTVGYNNAPVVTDIEFEIRPGEILTLMGPNGAGKSTLLKTITGQLSAVGGCLVLEGTPMDQLSFAQIAKRMSIMMTNRVDPELMTCEDVVKTGRYPFTGRLGILSAEDKEKVTAAMERVHCQDLRNRAFSRISDGQRQLVMLARAICQEPKVLVMDEPTSFLDIRHKLELLTVLKQLVREENLAVVLSLHELELAEKISDRILCIRDGKVDRIGSPREIFVGNYVEKLYGLTFGSYNTVFGSPELERPKGDVRVFVIGGGGSGIPVYRELQRKGIPFAAGILHENDLDMPVAKALATEVIAEQAFEPIAAETVDRAKEMLCSCESVIVAATKFGTMNRANEELAAMAESLGKIKES